MTIDSGKINEQIEEEHCKDRQSSLGGVVAHAVERWLPVGDHWFALGPLAHVSKPFLAR